MRAVVQRVERAAVRVDGALVGEIGAGVLILLGVAREDSEADADALAGKIARLRIFDNDDGRFDRSLLDMRGGALVVSQFTLIADTAKGNRPSFADAARPERGPHRLRRRLPRADGGRARQRRPGDVRPRRAGPGRRLLTASPGSFSGRRLPGIIATSSCLTAG